MKLNILILSLSYVLLVNCCNNDDVKINDKCYDFSQSKKSYMEAVASCRSKNMDIISVDSSFLASYISSLAVTRFGSNYLSYWIGGHRVSNQDYYITANGFRMNFTNWAPGQPFENQNYISARVSDGKWESMDSDKTFNYVCEYDNKKKPLPKKTNCSKNTTDLFINDRCFYFINQLLTPLEAQQYCREHYTSLATINSATIANSVSSTAVSKFSSYYGSFWIGLHHNQNQWKWFDEQFDSENTFLNFAPGYPFENQLYVAQLISSGKWITADGNQRKHFVCN